MNDHKNGAKKVNECSKDNTIFTSEKKKFLRYLLLKTATCSMVCAATGIPQKNATRYKRQLELSGLLWPLHKAACKATGYKAFYLTCNPSLFNAPIQLKLFRSGRK